MKKVQGLILLWNLAVRYANIEDKQKFPLSINLPALLVRSYAGLFPILKAHFQF